MLLAQQDGQVPLPPTDRKVYVEGIPADEAARLGVVVDSPQEADLAVVRVEAPFDPRDDLVLEAFFHQGSLDLRPGLVARLRRIAGQVPLILDVNLERPAIVTPLLDFASAVVGSFGASPPARTCPETPTTRSSGPDTAYRAPTGGWRVRRRSAPRGTAR